MSSKMGDERLDFWAKSVGQPAGTDQSSGRFVMKAREIIPILSFRMNPFFDARTEAGGHSGCAEDSVRE